jgi:hypothetical protein
MKNLIGNQISVLFKDSSKVISGVLVETNERFDYIQLERVLCVVPKENVLYYETDKLIKESKIIGGQDEKKMAVYVDNVWVGQMTLPHGAGANEIVQQAYGIDEVRTSLIGKKQKTVECFDDAVYILTDSFHATPPPQVEFYTQQAGSPANTYLGANEMIKRLDKVVKRE